MSLLGSAPVAFQVEVRPADEHAASAEKHEAVLRLHGVTLTYLGADGEPVHAVGGIDLDVRNNEFLVVLGLSGCGKSTLLKLMVGLLRPTEGRVFHRGREVLDTLRDVGMVYQNPLLLPWRNVLDNVLLPVQILGWSRKEYEPKARSILESVGLGGFADKMPRQLSGGMQQRVGLCRALITDPTLLLIDEPFAALDALTRDEMARELARLWEQRKKTVVFVTTASPRPSCSPTALSSCRRGRAGSRARSRSTCLARAPTAASSAPRTRTTSSRSATRSLGSGGT
jgi:NitT/TauT family transport system ATP-binding protein